MLARLLFALSLAGPVALGCGGQDPGQSAKKPIPWQYPLDDQIRINQLQLKATHNSYHVAELAGVPQLAYTHAPLDVQLRDQGVRGFELDTWWEPETEEFLVLHAKLFDDVSNCPRLVECLSALEAWSRDNPAHHLLFVQIEPKNSVPVADPEVFFERFESAITSVWPRERILAPDDVRQGAPSLREALGSSGWPTLGETRGKILFFVNDRSQFRDAYTRNGQGIDGRLMFAEADPGSSWEAIYVLNDPLPDAAKIAAAVADGFIVRTRADSDNVEPIANDTTRLEAALASGAQLISTDYPAKVPGVEYVVEIPNGVPSRCNPKNAPAECTPEAIENPEFIR
jgi:hypothetical protein